ncbi:hypothetical protein E3N88_41671 [Mikania micrantha]|uniref:Uncharacterized protein n=1 Tax=Mikania micrantha TaxID=192012 RepID=A0A5N6LJZ3_9ASTR|nr:hypothetical protein E3N88_41671 [Mikania micrantha]
MATKRSRISWKQEGVENQPQGEPTPIAPSFRWRWWPFSDEEGAAMKKVENGGRGDATVVVAIQAVVVADWNPFNSGGGHSCDTLIPHGS